MASTGSAAERARAASITNAGLTLAALLFGLAWWEVGQSPSPGPLDCPHPVEISRQAGRTVSVRCAQRPGPEVELHGPAVLLFGRPIDVNRADPGTLESLPGIGPGRARAIVKTRAERPFTHLDDLQRVPGIGPRTVAGLHGWAAASPVEPPVETRATTR
ncbi:MAG: helix-hairpin-helix domain-containing protein [Deltaproteobacteria bacterium]|nr:helix-hairpin-helix domain-containing protein [Deltaproteobacteria bacterium]MBW2697424.1 helix-hairpin-helix domain-containing protein [Deltaproteobacteria bacterium]